MHPCMPCMCLCAGVSVLFWYRSNVSAPFAPACYGDFGEVVCVMQSLAGWCLSYCRDKDSKDMAVSSVISTAHTSTRLDLDAGPAKGIQHQVCKPPCHPCCALIAPAGWKPSISHVVSYCWCAQ